MQEELTQARTTRARAIAAAGGIGAALQSGALPRRIAHWGATASGRSGDGGTYNQAVEALRQAQKVVVRVGGREAGPELQEFLELADAVAITSPVASGAIPGCDNHWNRKHRYNTFAIQREARGLFCGRIEPSVGMA
jgi:thiamine pyrophosphate-dependent acetolactate synthase large subunit-like protein